MCDFFSQFTQKQMVHYEKVRENPRRSDIVVSRPSQILSTYENTHPRSSGMVGKKSGKSGATKSCKLSHNNARCCPYYHLRVQQVEMQKVDVVSTFLQHENVLRAQVVISAKNNLNLQCNIVAQKLHENVARGTLPQISN